MSSETTKIFDRFWYKAVSLEGGRQIWSPALLDFFGLKLGSLDASAELFLSFVHPEDHQGVDELVRSASFGRSEETFFRVVRRNGSVRLVSLVCASDDGTSGCDRVWLLDYTAHLSQLTDGALSMGHVGLNGHIPVGTWMLCEAAGDLTLSPASREILGVGPGERFTSAQFLRVLSPDHRAIVAHAVESVSGPGSITHATVTFLRLNDRAGRTIELSIAEKQDAKGHRLALWGTIRDVTDAERRAGALESAESLTSTVLSTMDDGAMVLDGAARLLRLNSAARRLLGLREEDEGRTLWELCPSLLGDRFYQDFRSAVERHASVEQERYIPALKQWVHYSLAPLEDGVLAILTRRDEIYEQRALLNELSDRCRTAFSWGRVGIWELDTRTDRIWYSDPEAGLTGAGVTTLAEFLATLRTDDVPAVEAARQAAISEGTSFDVDVQVVSRAGETKRFRLRGGPDLGAGRSSRLRGVVIELRDTVPAPMRSTLQSGKGVGQTISGAQVRAARGALRWSVRELSERSDVSVATINRFEAGSRTVAARDSSVAALQRVLVAHGVSFFNDVNGYPALSITPAALLAVAGSDDEDSIDERSSYDGAKNGSARLNS